MYFSPSLAIFVKNFRFVYVGDKYILAVIGSIKTIKM